MLHQSVATNSRPNSQSVKSQLDITRIYPERRGPPRSRWRGERERGFGGEKQSNPHSTTNACSPVGKRNTFWVEDCCQNSVPVVLFISK